jgi:hypothetical protein
MACVRLPDDMIVAIARLHETARPLLNMIATCKSWRSALIARDAELCKVVALRRFPRLAHIVRHMEQGKSINWKNVYENQRKAEESKPARCVQVTAADHLSQYIFTIELLDEKGAEMSSWTDTFLLSGASTFLAKLPGCYSRVAELFEYLEDNTDVLDEDYEDKEPADWTLRCFLTGSLDMASTVKLYDGTYGDEWYGTNVNNFAEGPRYPFMFENSALPLKHVLNLMGAHGEQTEEMQFRVQPSLFLYAPPDEAEAPHVLLDFFACGEDPMEGDQLLEPSHHLTTIIHALRSCLPHGAVACGAVGVNAFQTHARDDGFSEPVVLHF